MQAASLTSIETVMDASQTLTCWSMLHGCTCARACSSEPPFCVAPCGEHLCVYESVLYVRMGVCARANMWGNGRAGMDT
eukprot:243323-Pelagomonas_calceolata.AAC.1